MVIGEKSKETRGICLLCKKEAVLMKSHGIPKFVGKRLKDTSATGFLRDGANPNRRAQDLPTRRMLCSECEQRFAVHEGRFQREIFDRFRTELFQSVCYDIWLLKFIVSLNWRMLVINAADVMRDYPQFAASISETLLSWEAFLLDQRSKPGSSEHHLFIHAGPPASMSGQFHEKTLHYLLRGVDGTPGVGDRTLFVYCNCMGYIFISPIVPRRPVGLAGTRVTAGPGILRAPQTIAMPSFGQFLSGRVEEAFKISISDGQNQKIADAMISSPECTLASDSVKVEEATRRLMARKTSIANP